MCSLKMFLNGAGRYIYAVLSSGSTAVSSDGLEVDAVLFQEGLKFVVLLFLKQMKTESQTVRAHSKLAHQNVRLTAQTRI